MNFIQALIDNYAVFFAVVVTQKKVVVSVIME
jgi:hypothetical protein